MFTRWPIVLALTVFAAPLAAQSGSIRASATVVSTPAIIQQVPALHRVTERVTASLGIRIPAHRDPWASHELPTAFVESAPGHVQAIREVDPGAVPDAGSGFRVDTQGLTAWAWTEGSRDRTIHMIIADLTR